MNDPVNGRLKIFDVKEKYPITELIKYPDKTKVFTKIYRVKCDFSSDEEINAQSTIAVIDQNDFEFNKNESNLSLKKLSASYLNYQLPTFIDATKPKKKAIAHCIHMLYDLEFDQHKDSLEQFFDMLIDLQIDQAKMYIYRHHSLVDLSLKERFKFLSVVYHEAVHHRVCQLEIYNLKRQPDSVVNQYAYDQCMVGFRKFFQIIEIARVKAIHDKINTNDCYLNFRHVYEVVTNYDFDEFIWPHKTTFGQVAKYYSENLREDLQSVCNLKALSFNAFEHEALLLRKVPNSGSLKLDHVVMLGFTNNLNGFFEDLEKSLNHSTFIDRLVNYTDYGHVIKFRVIKSDMAYVHYLVKNYKIVRKMYEYLNQTNVRWNFNRAIALHAPVRLGKTIFNTDKAEVINAHNADIPKSTALSHTSAYVSHFRKFYDGFIKSTSIMSITKLHIDIEYYHYLFAKFASSNFC